MTQNCCVKMVINVDQLVAGTSSSSFPTLLYLLIKQWTSIFVFAFIILQTVGNSLSQYRKAEIVWILGFLRYWDFF